LEPGEKNSGMEPQGETKREQKLHSGCELRINVVAQKRGGLSIDHPAQGTFSEKRYLGNSTKKNIRKGEGRDIRKATHLTDRKHLKETKQPVNWGSGPRKRQRVNGRM